jgi:hypothetical protein
MRAYLHHRDSLLGQEFFHWQHVYTDVADATSYEHMHREIAVLAKRLLVGNPAIALYCGC